MSKREKKNENFFRSRSNNDGNPINEHIFTI